MDGDDKTHISKAPKTRSDKALGLLLGPNGFDLGPECETKTKSFVGLTF